MSLSKQTMKNIAQVTLLFTIFSSAIAAAGAPSPSFPVVSGFSTNNEGWIIPFNGNPAAYSNTGGNPGGYIRYVSAGSAPSDIRAPSKFLGDWSSLDGAGSLSYAHAVFNQSSVNATFSNAVTISGPGGRAIWTGPAAPAPNSGWQNLRIPILSNSWMLTSGDWVSLLTNVTTLNVRLELYANSAGGVDQEGIDNVRLQIETEGPRLAIHCSQIELCWDSLLTKTYQLQYRSDLTANEWLGLGSAIQGDGNRKCITDSVTEGQPQKFYRIVQAP